MVKSSFGFSLFEKVAFTTCWVFSFFTFCHFWKNPVFGVFCHFFVTFLFKQCVVKVGDFWKLGSKKWVRKCVEKTCFLKWPKTWNSRFWPTYKSVFLQKGVQKVTKMGHFGHFWPFLDILVILDIWTCWTFGHFGHFGHCGHLDMFAFWICVHLGHL